MTTTVTDNLIFIPDGSGSDVYREDLNIVIVGHVDHGKSTIIGRLLADTHSLPEGKLDFIKEMCRKNSKPFEYAFLLDALKDERTQGITIDSARCFFKTAKRDYIIIDAPGHIEFLKNMVTGASRAEAALLVIDATEGIQENSRRHGYILKMLGIKQVAVLVNKMDLVNFDRNVFEAIVEEYSRFLKLVGIEASVYIPVSGMQGDNIAMPSDQTPFYTGPTVLETLDAFISEKLPEDKPFRMPVQDVYKFTAGGDTRRIVAGTIESGKLRVGDEVVFYPSGKKSRVASLEAFPTPSTPDSECGVGFAAGFTLTEQIYVKRGEVVALSGEAPPKVSACFRANLFWLGREAMVSHKQYYLKLGTEKIGVRLEEVIRVIDATSLNTSSKKEIGRHDVAECILHTERAIAFDLVEDLAQTGRFVIVDHYEIVGGGIVLEDICDKQKEVRDWVTNRNYKWEKSMITPEQRAERYHQKPALMLITGSRNVGKKSIAKELEQRLFQAGKNVYFLGIGNLLYGVDADIKYLEQSHRGEHLRRLAEVAHILVDSGSILIVTAVELRQEDIEVIKTVVDEAMIQTVWIGDVTTDLQFDLHISRVETTQNAVDQIKDFLQDQGIIFKP